MGKPDVEKMRAKKDVEGLTKALDSKEDAEVRIAAAKALGQICDILAKNREWDWYQKGPPPCIEPLMAMCSDKNLEVSKTAIWALGRMGDLRALGVLVTIQQDEKGNAERRKAAAEAMSSGATNVFADLMAIWRTQGAPWLK